MAAALQSLTMAVIWLLSNSMVRSVPLGLWPNMRQLMAWPCTSMVTCSGSWELTLFLAFGAGSSNNASAGWPSWSAAGGSLSYSLFLAAMMAVSPWEPLRLLFLAMFWPASSWMMGWDVSLSLSHCLSMELMMCSFGMRTGFSSWYAISTLLLTVAMLRASGGNWVHAPGCEPSFMCIQIMHFK